MSLTLAGRNQVLPSLLTGTLYVALHSADPGDAGTNNELTDGNYTRQAVAFSVDSATGLASNTSALSFPTLAGAAMVTHISIKTAATDGTTLVRQPLAAGQSFNAAGVPSFAAGAITVGGV